MKLTPQLDCSIEGGERFLVIHVAPGPADGPGAKADFRNLPAGTAKFAILHVMIPPFWLFHVVLIAWCVPRDPCYVTRVIPCCTHKMAGVHVTHHVYPHSSAATRTA